MNGPRDPEPPLDEPEEKRQSIREALKAWDSDANYDEWKDRENFE